MVFFFAVANLATWNIYNFCVDNFYFLNLATLSPGSYGSIAVTFDNCLRFHILLTIKSFLLAQKTHDVH